MNTTSLPTCEHGLVLHGPFNCGLCDRERKKKRKSEIAQRGGRLAKIGAYTKRIQPARNSWKKTVIGFDDGFCAYHANVYGELVEATQGDHILPQGQNRKHVLDPWNGIAACDECNRAHFDGLIKPTVRKVSDNDYEQTINGVWRRFVTCTDGVWWATAWEKN